MTDSNHANHLFEKQIGFATRFKYYEFENLQFTFYLTKIIRHNFKKTYISLTE